MMKSEMSADLLEARELFLRKLKDAGWETMDRGPLLDRGMSVEPEAEAEYSGPFFDIACRFVAKDQCLHLELIDRETGVVYLHRLHVRGGLSMANLLGLLDVLVASQDQLNLDSYPSLTKALIPFCDPLLVESEEGLLQMTNA